MAENSITLTQHTKQIKGTVQLTGSKSESNRALIIKAIGKGKVDIANLSAADDTVLLEKALQLASSTDSSRVTIDIGPAGTAMRFMTSYLCTLKGQFELTGTQRMQQRPIGLLVDALKEIGADISYANKNGYPPLLINGQLEQYSSIVKINGDVSSQYISSLLLIASTLKEGLTLEIVGDLTSRPYVLMTLNMLEEAGIYHSWVGNKIHIAPQEAIAQTLYIEPDWSAASYWYAIVALSKEAVLRLPGLKKNSLQGDIAIVEIMAHFGVKTSFEENGILLEKTNVKPSKNLFDFKECPDLAQTIVVVAAALKQNIALTGLETLKIKETDRIAALQNEIAKFGAKLTEDNTVYHLETSGVHDPGDLSIATYEDHRMAMAFAPLALVFNKVSIEDPQVVEKSYPMFWEHLADHSFKF